jgi:hypothetical protein
MLRGKFVTMRVYILKIRDISNKELNDEPSALRKIRTGLMAVARL